MCVASQPAEITITGRIVDEITPKSAPRTESEAAWHFRDVTIDLDRQTLLRNGEEVRLRAKSFDVLAHLIRHAGKLVTKQEMLDAVWGEVAVTDDSLVQCLVEIRRALGETQDVIKTIRSRGYLLDAVVHPGAMVAVEARSNVVATTSGASNRWRLGVAGVLAVALVLGWAAWDQISRGPEGTVATARPVSREETLNPDARRAFEEGASLMMGRRSQVELQQARQAFERAVVLDPQFAPAHSALSNVLTILFALGSSVRGRFYQRPAVTPGAPWSSTRRTHLAGMRWPTVRCSGNGTGPRPKPAIAGPRRWIRRTPIRVSCWRTCSSGSGGPTKAFERSRAPLRLTRGRRSFLGPRES